MLVDAICHFKHLQAEGITILEIEWPEPETHPLFAA